MWSPGDPSHIPKYTIFANFFNFVSFKAVFQHFEFWTMDFDTQRFIPHWKTKKFVYIRVISVPKERCEHRRKRTCVNLAPDLNKSDFFFFLLEDIGM